MAALLGELLSCPVADGGAAMYAAGAEQGFAGIAVPLQLVTPAGTLSLMGTITVVGGDCRGAAPPGGGRG